MLKQKPCLSSPSQTISQRMYPKVKVRALQQDDEYDRPSSPLEGFNSLSIRDSTPPVKGVKNSLSVSAGKVPRSYIQRSITPLLFLPTSTKRVESEEDGNKPCVRASSLPRPRAVISSPDNDQFFGSKSKLKFQRPSALKNHNLAYSRQLEHSEGRCTRSSATSPLKKQDFAHSRQSERRSTRRSTSAMKNHDLAQSTQSEGRFSRTIAISALKNHDLAYNRHLEGKCTRASSTSALKNNDLARNRQSEGRYTRTSMASPLRSREYKKITHMSDMKAKNESAMDVRVPVKNITKAKPCFKII